MEERDKLSEVHLRVELCPHWLGLGFRVPTLLMEKSSLYYSGNWIAGVV